MMNFSIAPNFLNLVRVANVEACAVLSFWSLFCFVFGVCSVVCFGVAFGFRCGVRFGVRFGVCFGVRFGVRFGVCFAVCFAVCLGVRFLCPFWCPCCFLFLCFFCFVFGSVVFFPAFCFQLCESVLALGAPLQSEVMIHCAALKQFSLADGLYELSMWAVAG